MVDMRAFFPHLIRLFSLVYCFHIVSLAVYEGTVKNFRLTWEVTEHCARTQLTGQNADMSYPRINRIYSTPSVLKCKAFWLILSQTISSLTKFIEKKQ